jgi:hypothetical protein
MGEGNNIARGTLRHHTAITFENIFSKIFYFFHRAISGRNQEAVRREGERALASLLVHHTL